MQYVLIAALGIVVTVVALGKAGQGYATLFERSSCIIEGGTKESCGFPRTGATCRDGSSSSATGRGACSHHGGVAEWTY